MRLVLASTSRYRAALLERLGVPFSIAAPTCDEEALKHDTQHIGQLALMLAREKARSLADAYPDALLLGGDQIVEIDGEALGKPHTRERAFEQLTRMSGRAHRLWTAIALRAPDGTEDLHVDLHTLTMRALTRDEIERYVDADQPLDCAGSYKVENLGIALFERIEGDDFSAITGIPLIALSSMLRTRGISIP